MYTLQNLLKNFKGFTNLVSKGICPLTSKGGGAFKRNLIMLSLTRSN